MTSITLDPSRAPGVGEATPEPIDLHPEPGDMLAEIKAGLSSDPRTLPSKYFYDAAGSALFEKICDLDAYYLTRTELGIMRQHAAGMAKLIGPGRLVIEPGAGDGRKTRLLLEALATPAGYVPVEISRDALIGATRRMAKQFPALPMTPVCADYSQMQGFRWPDAAGGRLVYFPGSTLGNLHPDQARRLLRQFHDACGKGGLLLIGVDYAKDPAVMIRAYSDEQGVTAAFNYNLLTRLNREAGADFDLRAWAHEARWNEAKSRMESHLVSQRDQAVHIDDQACAFTRGESIRTECSYKYTDRGLLNLAQGFAQRAVWRDPDQWFGVFCLEAV